MEKFEVLSKEYYLNIINELYERVRTNYANEHNGDTDFDFGVEIEKYEYGNDAVVGYYLLYYTNDALSEWVENLSYTKACEIIADDKIVTAILTELAKR